MLIYEASYNANLKCAYYTTISFHKSKEQAEKAIKRHREDIISNLRNNFREERIPELLRFRDWQIFTHIPFN